MSALPSLSARHMNDTAKLLAECEQAIDAGTLPLNVFSDPDLFELEKERIFARTWSRPAW